MREKYLKGKKRTFKEQLISTFNPKWLDLYDYICGNDEAYTIQATSSNPSLYYHKDKQNATKETLATPLFCHHERYGETLHKATRRSLSYCHSEGARSATEESPLSTKDFLKESLERQLVCHSEHCEESLSNLLESPQRFFGAEAPQNDNKSDPQDKITLQGKLVCHSKHCGETPPELPATPLFCHSEGGRSPTEESLLSAKDSLKESLERQLLCHSERSEEYLYESLVAKRDSSVATLPQNDKLCYPQGKPTQDKPPHNKPAKSLKAKPLKLLYRAKAEVLCILEQKKGEIIALELDKPNSRIALKASQKSLRALPPHCVLKVAIASGEIREVLGVLEDPSIDQALALQSATPPHFSQEALNQAKALNAEVYKELYPHRLDLSHLSFCVIDPENAKDHDDAIYFEPETATLYVAIADVSEYVSPNTPLDKEARNRGFSIYFPHKVLPMLPFELSSLACSLRPNHLALALVYILKLSPEGEVLQSELKESLIMPKASISYEQLQRFLDKECLNEEVCDREVLDKKSLNNGFLDKDFKESPNTGSKHLLNHTSHPIPKDMQKWLKAYIPFVKAAKAKRLQNGYEFSSNEVELSLDSIGNISKWQKHTESLAHGVIEESMLLANTQSALLLATHAPKALYRIHPAPKARHIAELLFSFDTLRENSLTPTKGLKNHSNNVPHKNKSLRQKHHKPLSNQALHELISSLQQSAEPALRELVDSLIIKSFARASYACENIGHFGLGFPAYTHFTSPIRRYADLLTHRLLKAILHNAKSLAYLSHDLEAIANELNHKERQVALIERRFYELKALRHCQHLLTTHSPLTIQALTYDSLHALPLDTLPPFPLTFSYEQECYQHIKVEVKSVNLLQKVIYVEPK
ncbi:RNB domain-containing ribonuclease [Helicobacter marmotae]|uniref:RNB domain-containing ribonuclease n=2 Tax=Helicobacter marmotae TaxID=152490 RepID=A0A3D8I1D9_9HELI|nr:RNB domain-containing ribonuclease [Helicobacter marmotae]